MSLHWAAYDISRDSSREAVARILLRYGRRLQESVFEIEVEPEDLSDLRREVGPWLAASDLFDLVPVDTRRPESRISWHREPNPPDVELY